MLHSLTINVCVYDTNECLYIIVNAKEIKLIGLEAKRSKIVSSVWKQIETMTPRIRIRLITTLYERLFISGYSIIYFD